MKRFQKISKHSMIECKSVHIKFKSKIKKKRREGDSNSRSLARTCFMVKQFPGTRPTGLGDPGTSLATMISSEIRL